MPIIQTTLSTEEQKAHAVAVAKYRLKRDFKIMRDNWLREFNWFWHHPVLTPQEMAEAWGAEGQEVFESSGAMKALLLAIDPNCLDGVECTPTFQFSFPGDGTVILGEAA